jgi:hypothetical protein
MEPTIDVQVWTTRGCSLESEFGKSHRTGWGQRTSYPSTMASSPRFAQGPTTPGVAPPPRWTHPRRASRSICPLLKSPPMRGDPPIPQPHCYLHPPYLEECAQCGQGTECRTVRSRTTSPNSTCLPVQPEGDEDTQSIGRKISTATITDTLKHTYVANYITSGVREEWQRGMRRVTKALAEGEMGAKLGGFRIEAYCTWWFCRDKEVTDTKCCRILRRQFRGSWRGPLPNASRVQICIGT